LILPHDAGVFALAPVAPRSGALNKTLPPRTIHATLPASLRCGAPKSHGLTPPKMTRFGPVFPNGSLHGNTCAAKKKASFFASDAQLGNESSRGRAAVNASRISCADAAS